MMIIIVIKTKQQQLCPKKYKTVDITLYFYVNSGQYY